MSGLDSHSVGDTVEFTVEAEITAVYDSGRIAIRWNSGDEIIYPSDTRLGSTKTGVL
jgi:hypothetical protein